MEPGGLREYREKPTKFGRRVGSPATLLMVVIGKDYVKNEAVVVRLYRQWWRYAEGPFNDEAVKGQCTGCCRRRGSGYQRAAHRCARLVPHMAGLTRCLHQSHITLRDPVSQRLVCRGHF